MTSKNLEEILEEALKKVVGIVAGAKMQFLDRKELLEISKIICEKAFEAVVVEERICKTTDSNNTLQQVVGHNMACEIQEIKKREFFGE